MRLRTFAPFMAAVLMLPVNGRADTFVFTPTGGSAISFDTESQPYASYAAAPWNYAQYHFGGSVETFFGTSEGLYWDATYGYGPTPFDFEYVTADETVYLEDGPQLFTGTVDNPSFIPGTYSLVGDSGESNDVGGTLVIDGGGVAVTPEPSSLILLGTGALGCAWEVRRRLGSKGHALAFSL